MAVVTAALVEVGAGLVEVGAALACAPADETTATRATPDSKKPLRALLGPEDREPARAAALLPRRRGCRAG